MGNACSCVGGGGGGAHDAAAPSSAGGLAVKTMSALRRSFSGSAIGGSSSSRSTASGGSPRSVDAVAHARQQQQHLPATKLGKQQHPPPDALPLPLPSPPPPPPADEIEAAMAAARAELDAAAAPGARALTDDFDVGRIIGHGAFARVARCTRRADGAVFAVKSVQKRQQQRACAAATTTGSSSSRASVDLCYDGGAGADGGGGSSGAGGRSRQQQQQQQQREAVAKEVAIMRLLAGHPHAVTLEAVYEDESCFHLVMELCSGGELFDRIVRRGHFTEADAAGAMRALLSFVAHAHSKHVMHRDLKPENVLILGGCSGGGEAEGGGGCPCGSGCSGGDGDSSDGGAVLKVVDFGTSEFCRPGQRLTTKFGTPYYVAVEVLHRDYDLSADVWSAGVICFILLCGSPPFNGRSDARILQRVVAGAYSFAAPEWDAVSPLAKDFVSRMLVVDPSKRASAAELLEHPWLAPGAAAKAAQQAAAAAQAAAGAVGAVVATAAAPAEPTAAALGAHMARRLRAFASASHLKRLALVVLARTLTDRDVARLRELFAAMDQDGDGRITPKDLHQALQRVGAAIAEGEMAALFAASDATGTGTIDYEAFIAAMIDSPRIAQHRRDAVRRSFEVLDRDRDGLISVEDLASVLQDERPHQLRGPRGRKMSLDLAATMVAEADADKDGSLSFDEFQQLFAGGHGGNGGPAGGGAAGGGGTAPTSYAPAASQPYHGAAARAAAAAAGAGGGAGGAAAGWGGGLPPAPRSRRPSLSSSGHQQQPMPPPSPVAPALDDSQQRGIGEAAATAAAAEAAAAAAASAAAAAAAASDASTLLPPVTAVTAA